MLFAHVGISHESHADESSAVLALCRLLLVNLRETLLQERYALQDDTAVHLKLRLTRTTQAHRAFATARAATASLTLKVRPQSLQTWQHIAVLRQFHLCLGVGRLRAHCENVEDERRAVEYFHLQLVLDVPAIVEDYHTHRAFRILLVDDVLSYLL